MTIAVACALVVPSLVVGPAAVFPEVPVAVPPEHGLSVVRAAAPAVPHDRRTAAPARNSAPRPEHPRIAHARPAHRVVVAAPAPRPVSRPPAAPTTKPAPSSPTPTPTPTPTPQPAPTPTPTEREILVAEPEPATPPHGKPVVDESSAPEPAKHEGEKKGHEKNEPQGNANGRDRDDDQRGGPNQDRGPRD